MGSVVDKKVIPTDVICPSCSTRRMVEIAAQMVDDVLPRVQFRQWVLSVPKRVRWHMAHKPEVVSGLLGVFLRAVETTVRQRSPDAVAGSRFGTVAFVHRFGSYLNSLSLPNIPSGVIPAVKNLRFVFPQ